MRRWLIVAAVLVAGGVGWQRTAALRAHGAHEVVAVNRTGHTLEGLRLAVGGESVSFDSLPIGATARAPFRCPHEGAFDLRWRLRGDGTPRHWKGGRYADGPLPLRYRFEFTRGDGVVANVDRKPVKTVVKTAAKRAQRRR